MKENERHVAVVGAALEILQAYDRDVAFRLKDLHERTGQTRSRLLRLLGTLESYGFIQQNGDGSYELGGALHRIGVLMSARYSHIADIVRPKLARLVEKTSDTAFLSGIEGLRRVVLVAEESSDALRFTAREGQTRPLHVGASSKVLLAFADDDTREQAVASLSPDELGQLSDELSSIRECGFSVSRGEVTPYGFAISVPVQVPSGRVYALSLAGVLGKLNDQLVDGHLALLREQADALATSLPSPMAN